MHDVHEHVRLVFFGEFVFFYVEVVYNYHEINHQIYEYSA